MKKIGILYICTGKYKLFWNDFYKSCETYFLDNEKLEKHYYVFTDADNIEFENEQQVHKIYQDALPWPYITLYRYKIFNKISRYLKKMDYLYFFNANMLFVDTINDEFLPKLNQKFSFLQHPGFYNKNNADFTYERNSESLAFIAKGEGKYYFAGGLNGGNSKDYLLMSEKLEQNIDLDEKKDVMACWHDESHLNRFAFENQNIIKVIDPSYGYPEGWEFPFLPKILIRDKKKIWRT